MTNKQLFDSLNDADDKYIIEAVEDFPELDVRKKRGFTQVLKYALPCAACAAVVFAGVSFIGNNAGGTSPLSTDETSSMGANGTVSTADKVIYANSGDSIQLSEHKYSDFLEEEKKFSETFVSPGIVYGEPLALPEKDPATFWEGDLPVMPLKHCTNGWFEGTGNKFELDLEITGSSQTSLDAVRGEAVYAVADGEVVYVGIPGRPIDITPTVMIKHNDKLYTTYSTLDEDCGIPVKVGDKVKAGQVIGYAGIHYYGEPESETEINFGVFAYDPFDYPEQRSEHFEAWLNSGLAKPLDNVGDDFEFDYSFFNASRNEKITPAPYGANVYAVSGGTIVGCENDKWSNGLIIRIRHKTGIETAYYHLDSSFPHVESGDVVEAGDVIGHISNTSYNGVSGLGYYVDDSVYIADTADPQQTESTDSTATDAEIVYGEPMEIAEKDPATFWEGDLPVLPLKSCLNEDFKLPPLPATDGHSGMLINAKSGEAVYAVYDGEVTFIGYPGGRISRCLTVIIKHNEHRYAVYEILNEDLGIPVKIGDQVKAGQVIGYAGLNLDSGIDHMSETRIGFTVYGCDPLELYRPETTYFEDWLNSGLVKPLDNIDDFEFDSFREGLSRNEKITPAPYGANVYAVSDGKVGYAQKEENGAGFIVKIAYDEFITTVYYHLDENLPHVEWGDVVKAGDVIGHVSNNSCSGVSGLGYFVIDETYIRDFPNYRPPKEAEE